MAPRLIFWLHAFLFLVSLSRLNIPKEHLIMTRSIEVGWWFSVRGYRVIVEIHDWPRRGGWLATKFLQKASLVVSNSEGTKESALLSGCSRVVVAHNGVDLEALLPTRTRESVREELGIPPNQRVVLYAGALEAWKGYRILLEASPRMPDVTVVIVGGTDAHISVLKKEWPHVVFVGTKPYRELGNYQSMADVLVIPNDPAYAKDQAHTSPIKLFTYAASKRPVVVTDLPSIREVANEKQVYFFEGTPQALRDTILGVFADSQDGKIHGEALYSLAEKYTWTHRAEFILGALSDSKATFHTQNE